MTSDSESRTAIDGGEDWIEGELSDEELTSLALANESLDVAADAVPASVFLRQPSSLLPNWYMPAAMSFNSRGWRRPVIVGLVVVFVVIEALGLCSAFGQVVVG